MSSPNRTKKTQDQKARMIEDLSRQLDALVSSRIDKLEASKKHLLSQIEVTSKKYLTVNGYMQARTTMEQVAFGEKIENADELGCVFAREMSEMAWALHEKIEECSIEDIDEDVLDGWMDEHFVTSSPTFNETVRQVLVVGLLQNIGGAVDDIISFRSSVDDQIESIKKEIDHVMADGSEKVVDISEAKMKGEKN